MSLNGSLLVKVVKILGLYSIIPCVCPIRPFHSSYSLSYFGSYIPIHLFFFFFFLFYFLTTRTSILCFLIEAISCVLLSLGIFIFFILNLVHIYTYTLITVCFFLQIRDVIHMPKISSSPNHTLDYISKG